MAAPSTPNLGSSSRLYDYTYSKLDLDNVPSSAEVDRAHAAASAALQASSRPGDQWMSRFADGDVPSVEEAAELQEALEVFDPVIQQASARAQITLKAHIKDLQAQLAASETQVRELKTASEQRDEADRNLASQDERFQAEKQKKLDTAKSNLKQALETVQRLTTEKDEAVKEREATLAEAEAKAESDAAEFGKILQSKLKEQASVLASDAKNAIGALETKLKESALTVTVWLRRKMLSWSQGFRSRPLSLVLRLRRRRIGISWSLSSSNVCLLRSSKA
jgi:hypothetical protein